MIEHVVRFENAAHFVRDYDAHLSHDGLIVPISPAPPVYTTVKLTLHLPLDQASVELEATVVAELPHGVGVQITPLKGEAKSVMMSQLARCRQLVRGEAPPANSPIAASPSPPLTAASQVISESESGAAIASVSMSSQVDFIAPEEPLSPSVQTYAPSPRPSKAPVETPLETPQHPKKPLLPKDLPALRKRSTASSTPPSSSAIASPSPAIGAIPPQIHPLSTPLPMHPERPSQAQPELPSVDEFPPRPDAIARRDSPPHPHLPTLSTHVVGENSPEIAPSLQIGALDSFLLPGDDDASEQSSAQTSHPLLGEHGAFGLGGAEAREELPALQVPEHVHAYGRPSPQDDVPPREKAPITIPPPSQMTAISRDDLLPAADVPLDYFPPEEIQKDASSSQDGLHGPSDVPGHASGWEQPGPPSADEHLSVSAAGWPSVSYSYDALPAAHFTPPPDTLSVPATPSRVTPSLKGLIEETPTLKLFLDLASQDATGMLHLLAMDATYNVFFHLGKIVCITEDPTPEAHLIGQVLIELGYLTERQRDEMMSQVHPADSRFGKQLIEAGMMTIREVAQGLRRQLQRRIGALLKLHEGHFTFYEKRLPSKKTALAPPTLPSRLIFRALVEMYGKRPSDEARQTELPYLSQYVVRTNTARGLLQDLQLSDNEQGFWDELLAGKHTLRGVYQGSPFTRRRTHATIFALFELGMIEFQPELDEDWQIREVSDFYQARYKMINKDSYFSFMGLHWTASKADINAAYARMGEEYDITKRDGDWPESIVAMSKAILQHLEEAKDNLTSGRDRKGLRDSITSSSQLQFSAELLVKKADLAMYRKDFDEAIDCFRQVLELEPGNEIIKAKLSAARKLKKEGADKGGDGQEGFALNIDWERLNRDE